MRYSRMPGKKSLGVSCKPWYSATKKSALVLLNYMILFLSFFLSLEVIVSISFLIRPEISFLV